MNRAAAVFSSRSAAPARQTREGAVAGVGSQAVDLGFQPGPEVLIPPVQEREDQTFFDLKWR